MSLWRRPFARAFGLSCPVPRLLLAALLAVGAAVMTHAAGPQDPPAGQAQAARQEQPPRPTFRVEARFVRVDVYPTSHDRPVTDLAADDFEVLEDGVPQKVETFEHVVVRAAGAQEARVEPTTVGESRAMAADPRARLFVLFLDTYHVEQAALHNIRMPLVKMLDRLIGQDDLVALMMPEMAAGDVSFARKTGSIEEILSRHWDLGRRDDIEGERWDPMEKRYTYCYPATKVGDVISPIAWEMIQRRREKMALDALSDLVVHLQGLREERKAILTISEGWRLYRPDRNLMQGMPDMGGMGYDPRSGRLGRDPASRNATGDLSKNECDRDRMMLAQLDNERTFRDLLDLANRANASFYPIDPRGLPVFDAPIGPRRPENIIEDGNILKQRLEALHTVAGATDGIAITGSNDLDRGLKRVVDDLSSYYLLGYYSTNTKLDGKFRKIAVRVKRPGVNVRARRGYLAATEEEIAAREKASAPPAPPTPVETALSSLSGFERRLPARLRAGYAWQPGEPGTGSVWVLGELDDQQARAPEWQSGGTATVSIKEDEGDEIGSGTAPVSRAVRGFLLRMPEAASLPPGDYLVRLSIQPSGGGAPVTDAVHIVVREPEAGGEMFAGQPLVFRRGPFTGVNYLPTADLRFRRQERLRIELPLAGDPASVAAMLLDRNGKPMAIPVTATVRKDEHGAWMQAEAALAALAPGDYLLEATLERPGGQEKRLMAFRIVP